MKPTIYIPSHLAKLFFVCMQREVLGIKPWPSCARATLRNQSAPARPGY
jgi:hypothetical protein